MAYIRKTVDRWEIETNYGHGWEIESSYYNRDEAKTDLLGYRELTAHYGGAARIVKRRETLGEWLDKTI